MPLRSWWPIHVIDGQQNQRSHPAVLAVVAAAPDARSQLTKYSFNPDGSLFTKEAIANAYASVQCNGGTPLQNQIVAEM